MIRLGSLLLYTTTVAAMSIAAGIVASNCLVMVGVR